MATLSSSITIPAGGTGRICFLLTWHFQLMEKYWGKSTFGRRYRWKQYYAKAFVMRRRLPIIALQIGHG